MGLRRDSFERKVKHFGWEVREQWDYEQASDEDFEGVGGYFDCTPMLELEEHL
jgi:hypothetical protein